MLGNLVNRRDIDRVRSIVRDRKLQRVIDRTFARNRSRVEQAWAHTSARSVNWWNVPGITERWNAMVTDDAAVDPRSWFIDRYAGGRSDLVGLSIGCGTGARERAWAASGHFSRLDAIDLSAPRIDHARREASDAGLDDVLHFEVADLDTFGAVGGYDVIIAEQSLHHFDNMPAVMQRFHDLLRPGGFVYLDEFVGPRRFQWTQEQVAASHDLIAQLPQRLRRQSGGNGEKDDVAAPSLLAMRLKDPSEAVESDRILTELARTFDVLDVKGYGGTVLHLVLPGIAENFLETDQDTEEWRERCFEFEDACLSQRNLPHDFVVAVARRC